MAPRSLAQQEQLLFAAERIAHALRESTGTHQEYAAVQNGICRSVYWALMSGEDDFSRSFQSIVEPALHEQAAACMETAEQDIGRTENGSSAWVSWHKWKLEKKFRKIYGDLAQAPKQLELTGKGGGAIDMRVSQMSDAEIAAKLAAIASGEGDE